MGKCLGSCGLDVKFQRDSNFLGKIVWKNGLFYSFEVEYFAIFTVFGVDIGLSSLIDVLKF